MPMTVNLHTHTFRCSHAKGTERDYIERALANGITRMGFADHAPFAFPDGSEEWYRVPMAQATEYVSTLRALREEYRDRIEILIGFEMEYYPTYFADMRRIAADVGAEYLILGQHHVEYQENGEVKLFYSGKATDSAALLKGYVDEALEAMGTGAFTYMAHPELIRYEGDEAIYEREMRRLCQGASEMDIPLEINFLGLRENRHYPIRRFWQWAKEYNCRVVFGCDAHDPMSAYDAESLAVAESWVKELALRLEPNPPIRSIY
ncbi:MAG: histidinol-phosphatase [Clostridia bacterium]|nr:histidinol-phosphatase [Clostridia bacterium]